MFNPFKRTAKNQPAAESQGSALTWDSQAQQGLDKAMSQAPVPAMLKAKVRRELAGAAEASARQAGRTTVTAEDLLQGLLAKLPAGMRGKVEDAMKGGPDKLKDLQKELGG